VAKEDLAKRLRCNVKVVKAMEDFERKTKYLSEHLADVLRAELKPIVEQVADVQRKFHLDFAAMVDGICANDAAGLGRWKATGCKAGDASAPAISVHGRTVELKDMSRTLQDMHRESQRRDKEREDARKRDAPRARAAAAEAKKKRAELERERDQE